MEVLRSSKAIFGGIAVKLSREFWALCMVAIPTIQVLEMTIDDVLNWKSTTVFDMVTGRWKSCSINRIGYCHNKNHPDSKMGARNDDLYHIRPGFLECWHHMTLYFGEIDSRMFKESISIMGKLCKAPPHGVMVGKQPRNVPPNLIATGMFEVFFWLTFGGFHK